MTAIVTVGQRVGRLRRERGLTQTDIAGPNLSASYVSLIEAGRREPTLKALEQLASRLGVTADYLRHGHDRDRPGELTRSEVLVRTVTWSFPEVHETLLSRVLTAVHRWDTSADVTGRDATLVRQLRASLRAQEEQVGTFELVGLVDVKKTSREIDEITGATSGWRG